MSENKTSIIYSIAAGSSLVVFVLAMAGLFLPLVKINGDTITIYETIKQIFDFIGNIGSATIGDVIILSGIIRNTVVIATAVSLFVRIILSFVSYLLKNIRNLIHPNDFYGEDVVKVSLHIAFFTAVMYAYYPEWHLSIGMALMNIASIAGLVIVAILRIEEALKSDEKGASTLHALFMIIATGLIYCVLFYGMKSPVAIKDSGTRIALVDNITIYASYALLNFSTDAILAFLLEVAAVVVIFRSLRSLDNACFCTLGCVKRGRRQRRKHVQREYHLRAIIHTLIGLVLFAAGIGLAVSKSEQAFGTQYTIGTTGILGIIGLVLAIVFVIFAKITRPGVNTYEKIRDEEETPVENA